MFFRSRGLRGHLRAFESGYRKAWSQRQEIGTVLTLGALAGLRSLLPQVIISRALRERAAKLPEPFHRLPTEPVTRALTGAALMEIASETASGATPRIRPLAFLGRILSGGIAGWLVISSRRRRYPAPLFFGIGAGAAALTTLGSHRARRFAAQRFGRAAVLWAVLEDGLALLAAREGMRRLER
jgi:uncharacterized membrane protein